MNSTPAPTTLWQKVHQRPVIAIAAVAIAVLVVVFLSSSSDEPGTSTAFFAAKQGDFLVTIVEGGNLEAVKEVSVRNEVEGTSRIIYIVPEGSIVKKNDLLVELDSSGAVEQLNQQMISYESATNALVQARSQLEIQKSVAESEIQAARLKTNFAYVDLQRYIAGQALQDLRKAEVDITSIQESLTIAEERLKWSEQLYDEGFETKSNLDRDRLTVLQNQLSLETATNELWMIQTFDYYKMTNQLTEDYKEAVKNLERVMAQAESRIAQYEADVVARQNTLNLNADRLDRDRRQLDATKLYAPQGGMVVYPVAEGRFSQESMIEEGATVRNRQELIKLPDTSSMKLLVKVHESQVGMVKPGQPAYVVIDSLPNERYGGYVNRVAPLPDMQRRWGNPDLKVYDTEVLITEELPDLKPGVSARAEIIITNIPNAVSVPLQAVTTLKGKQVVYQPGGSSLEPVEVEVGLYNTKFIQILKGLEGGEMVALNPPFDVQESDLSGSVLAEGETLSLTNRVVEPSPAPMASFGDQEDGPGGRQRGTPGGPGGEQGGPGGQAGGGRGFGGGARPDFEAIRKQFDADGDGELNETEQEAMRAEMRKRFEAMGGQSPRGDRSFGERGGAGQDGSERPRRQNRESAGGGGN